MEKYLFIVVFILATIASMCGYVRNAHIFQLNSYHMQEQLKWMRENISKHVPHLLVLMFLSLYLIEEKVTVYFIEILFFVFAVFYIKPKVKAKKRMVFTMRMIRLTVTSTLLIGFIGQFSFTLQSNLRYIIAPILFFISPFIPLLSNIVNMPIEKAIQKYYIWDAKRILKANPELIVIGITGSYGKTSVKYFLNTLLRAKYNVLMTPASFNTPMGVVKTIREQLRPTHDVFLCEMGARRVGEIKELCEIVNPTHGVITAIGPQHLETFKTIENIVQTKFELADAVKGKGMVFLNADNLYIKENCPEQDSFTYGANGNFNFSISEVRVTSNGTEFSMTYKKQEIHNLKTTLIGIHNVINLAGAIGVSIFLGVTEEQICKQLLKISAPPHRLELKNDGKVTIIDDAYNSNPSGSKAALDALALFDDYKILITPGMVELGTKQFELNKELGYNAAKVCDYIILVGEKQSRAIMAGITDCGYDTDCVFLASDFTQAFTHANSLATNKHKIILIENDLPDNYL